MPFAITLDAVTKRFGQTMAVDALSLQVPQGAIYGFIGPNGLGKTTTLRMITHDAPDRPARLVERTWQEEVARHLIYGATALCVLLPAVLPVDPRHVIRRLLDARVMRHLGRISYGLFLYQLVALELLYQWTDLERFTGSFVPMVLATAALTIAMAEVSWRLIEEPALRLKPSATRPAPSRERPASVTPDRE